MFLTKQSSRQCVRTQAAVKFSISKPVYYGAQIRVVGGSEALGAWDTTKGLVLEWAEGDQWTAQCEINETGPIEFKYAEIYIPDELESEFQWSGPDGSNIVLDLPSEGSVEIVSSWEGETLSVEHLAPVSASVPPPEAEAELPTPITKAAVPVVEDTKGEAVVALEDVKEAPIPVKNTIKPAPAPAPAPAAVRPPPAASPISTAVKEQAAVNIVEAPAAVKSKKGRATKLNATKAKA